MKRLAVIPFVGVILVGCAQVGVSASPVGSSESASTQPTPAVSLAASIPITPAASPTATLMPLTGRVAFVHNAAGGPPSAEVAVTDIWVVNARGGEPIALTTDPENEFSPFWLLDGSRLVFAVFDFRTAAGPYHGRLVSVLPDGSGRKDLGPLGSFDDVALSPDGRYVAWGGGGTDPITLLDRSTGATKVLTKDAATDPIWSPDSRALLVREPLLRAAAVVTVSSGLVTRFDNVSIESVVGWTADGESIVFNGTWMAPATGGAMVAFPPSGELAWPTWSSPDGRTTITWGSTSAGFAVVSGSVGEPTLAHGLTMLEGCPSWAADGRDFAFAGSTSDEVGDRKSGIYVVPLDGHDPVRITAGPYDTAPAWEPGS